MEEFDAIVLAGGAGRRLGGVDKAAVAIGSSRLLDRALAAVAAAARIVVVGPHRGELAGRVGERLHATQESPPGGGPVAAVASGLENVTQSLVVVLACDMPFFDATAAAVLVGGVGGSDGAVFVDETGRRQYLAAAYRRQSLEAAVARLDAVYGASMRQLVERLTLAELQADPETTLDCDTWDDIQRSRDIEGER